MNYNKGETIWLISLSNPSEPTQVIVEKDHGVEGAVIRSTVNEKEIGVVKDYLFSTKESAVKYGGLMRLLAAIRETDLSLYQKDAASRGVAIYTPGDTLWKIGGIFAETEPRLGCVEKPRLEFPKYGYLRFPNERTGTYVKKEDLFFSHDLAKRYRMVKIEMLNIRIKDDADHLNRAYLMKAVIDGVAQINRQPVAAE